MPWSLFQLGTSHRLWFLRPSTSHLVSRAGGVVTVNGRRVLLDRPRAVAERWQESRKFWARSPREGPWRPCGLSPAFLPP